MTNGVPASFGAPADPNFVAPRMNPGFTSIKGDHGIAEKRQALKVNSLLNTNIQGTTLSPRPRSQLIILLGVWEFLVGDWSSTTDGNVVNLIIEVLCKSLPLKVTQIVD